MCVRKAGWLGWLRVGSKIYICTFRETWLTWLTLIFISRGGLKFWIYVCRKRWLTSLTKGMLQNLDMYMSRNVVDLVDFDFQSQRRPKFIINVCPRSWLGSKSKNMYLSWNEVDLVDFDFRSHRRLEILNICVSEKLVD